VERPVLKRLLCVSVCAAGLLLSVAAVAATCPRSVEVVGHSSPALGFDEALFIQAFEGAFEDVGISLSAGDPEPEYVLAVSYDEFATDAGVLKSCLSMILGYVDGVIGEENVKSSLCGHAIYYGELVHMDGTIVTSGDLSAHEPTAAALAGELPERMARHEQTPGSAATIVRTECFSAGQTGIIKLMNFSSPSALPLEPSDIVNRLVATVARGKITNGVQLEGDDRSRVFTVPSRGSSRSVVEIEYEAPADGNGDSFTLRNSCDILSGKSLSETVPGEVIVTRELPGCALPSLEYAHEFTVEYGEGMLSYTMAGKIPLKITRRSASADDLDAGDVSGEGTLTVSMVGSFRECSVTYQSEMTCVVTGKVRLHYTTGGYERKIHLTLTESYGGVGGGAMIDCPKQEPFSTGGVWAPDIVQGEEARLIFDDVDGAEITRPFSADMVTGDAKWVLHHP